MDFSFALEAVKYDNHKIARTAWGDKGIFVVLQKGYPSGIPINQNTADALGVAEGLVYSISPYLIVHTADGKIEPWVATQGDLLAEDWTVAC